MAQRYQEVPEEEEPMQYGQSTNNVPKHPALEKLKRNPAIRFSGCIFGLGVPIITMVFLGKFIFGGLGSDGQCYSVEYPHTK